jgi:hypothetical protein
VNDEDERLYKKKYIIAIYDRDDETLKYLFNNLTEMCEALGWEVNRKNMNRIQVNMYRALKRPDHRFNLFRGQGYRVYIVDIIENDE